MKYCISILLVFLLHYAGWGQPVRPCLDFAIVIDPIKGVDMQHVNVYISHIVAKGNTQGSIGCDDMNMARPEAACYTLSIAGQDGMECHYATRYSTVSNKIYLERYRVFQPILTIEYDNEVMYIVFNRMPQFERALFDADAIVERAYTSSRNLGVKPYYMYISGITFNEGVFFLKEDYSHPSTWIKEMPLSALYEDKANTTTEVLVFAPYSSADNNISYYQSFPGRFSANEVIDIILKHQPVEGGISNALDFAKWKAKNGFIKETKTRSFMKTLNTLENKSRRMKDSLLASKKKYSEAILFDHYTTFRENDFFSILDDNRSLLALFHAYFKSGTEIRKHEALYKQNNYKMNKGELKDYYKRSGNHYEPFIDFIVANNYEVTKEKMYQFTTGLKEK